MLWRHFGKPHPCTLDQFHKLILYSVQVKNSGVHVRRQSSCVAFLSAHPGLNASDGGAPDLLRQSPALAGCQWGAWPPSPTGTYKCVLLIPNKKPYKLIPESLLMLAILLHGCTWRPWMDIAATQRSTCSTDFYLIKIK